MARRNPTLSGRFPLPLEELGECAACDRDGKTVVLIVAAKWHDTLWYRHRDPMCPDGGHLIADPSAEYYCPECHLVYENTYVGPMGGPNFFATRRAAFEFLGKPHARVPFPMVDLRPCDQGTDRPPILAIFSQGYPTLVGDNSAVAVA